MEGSEQKNVVEAEAFILRGKDGSVRARLGMADDNPSLEFYQAQGGLRLKVGISDLDPGVEVFDKEGKVRAWLGMDALYPQLVLYDASEQPRALVELNAVGSRVVLLEPGKEVHTGPPADEKGNPVSLDMEVIGQLELQVDHLSAALLLHNASNRGRIKLVAGDGLSSLALEDPNGKSCVRLIASNDAPCATFCDKHDRQRLGMGLKKGSPSVHLFDPRGKAMHSLE